MRTSLAALLATLLLSQPAAAASLAELLCARKSESAQTASSEKLDTRATGSIADPSVSQAGEESVSPKYPDAVYWTFQ